MLPSRLLSMIVLWMFLIMSGSKDVQNCVRRRLNSLRSTERCDVISHDSHTLCILFIECPNQSLGIARALTQRSGISRSLEDQDDVYDMRWGNGTQNKIKKRKLLVILFRVTIPHRILPNVFYSLLQNVTHFIRCLSTRPQVSMNIFSTLLTICNLLCKLDIIQLLLKV